jgi:chondroitin 4-sulfotransferase 11
MIISHKHKFIFICNGKTGTTSIERGLDGYDESEDMNNGAPGLWDGKHMPASVAKAMLPKAVWDGYFKFLFVRNPYDWFVSAYRHNFRSRLKLLKLVRHPLLAPEMVGTFLRFKRERSKQILDAADIDFHHGYLRKYRALSSSATLYQTNYACDPDGNLLVDFVGRFESLQQDVRKVQDVIGVFFDVPHLNATTRRPYHDCLTSAAMQRITELWAIDFRVFGYPEESKPNAQADQNLSESR